MFVLLNFLLTMYIQCHLQVKTVLLPGAAVLVESVDDEMWIGHETDATGFVETEKALVTIQLLPDLEWCLQIYKEQVNWWMKNKTFIFNKKR